MPIVLPSTASVVFSVVNPTVVANQTVLVSSSTATMTIVVNQSVLVSPATANITFQTNAATVSDNLRMLSLYLKRAGTINTPNLVLEVLGSNNAVIRTITKSFANLPTEESWVNFRFEPPINMADYSDTSFRIYQDTGNGENYVLVYHQAGYRFNGQIIGVVSYLDSDMPPNTIPTCVPVISNAAAFSRYSAINELSSFGIDNLVLQESLPIANIISLTPGFEQTINETPKVLFVDGENSNSSTANIGLVTHSNKIIKIADGTTPYNYQILSTCADGIYLSNNSGGNWKRISDKIANDISYDPVSGIIAIGGDDRIVYRYASLSQLQAGVILSQSTAYGAAIEKLLVSSGLDIVATQDGVFINEINISTGYPGASTWQIIANGNIIAICTDKCLFVYNKTTAAISDEFEGQDVRSASFSSNKTFVIANNKIYYTGNSLDTLPVFTILNATGFSGTKTSICCNKENDNIILGTVNGLYLSGTNQIIFRKISGSEDYFHHQAIHLETGFYLARPLSFGESEYVYEFVIDASGSQILDIEEKAQAIAAGILASAEKGFCLNTQRKNSYFQPVPDNLIQTRIYEAAVERPGEAPLTEITNGVTPLRFAVDGGYFLLSSRKVFATFDGSVITGKDVDNYYRTILISDRDGAPRIYIDGQEDGFPLEADLGPIIDFLLPKFGKRLTWIYESGKPLSVENMALVTAFPDGDTASLSEFQTVESPNSIEIFVDIASRNFEHTHVVGDMQLTINDFKNHLVILNNMQDGQDCVQYFALIDGDNVPVSGSRVTTVIDEPDYDRIEVTPRGGVANLKSYSVVWLDEEETVNPRIGLPQISSTVGDESLVLSVTSNINGNKDIAVTENLANIKMILIASEGLVSGTKITIDFGIPITSDWTISPAAGISRLESNIFQVGGFFSQGTVLTFTNTAILRNIPNSKTAEGLTTYPDPNSPQMVYGEASILVEKGSAWTNNKAMWSASIARNTFTHVHVGGKISQAGPTANLKITLCDSFGRISSGGNESIDVIFRSPGKDPVSTRVSFVDSDNGTKNISFPVDAGVYNISVQGKEVFAPTFYIGVDSQIGYNSFFGDPFAYDGEDFGKDKSGLDWMGIPEPDNPETVGQFSPMPKYQMGMTDNSKVCILGSGEGEIASTGVIESLSSIMKSSRSVAIARHPAYPLGVIQWSQVGDVSGISGIDIYSFHGAFENKAISGPLTLPTGVLGGYALDALKAGKRLAFFAGSGDSNIYPGIMGSNMPTGRASTQPPVNNRGLTCVFSNILNKSSLLQAMKSGRTTATTGARMNCLMRIAGRYMGDDLTVVSLTGSRLSTALDVQVFCEPTTATAAMEIILVKIGGTSESLSIVPVVRGGGWLAAGNFDSRIIEGGKGDYAIYAKAVQSDGHTAWISPIYIHFS